MLDEVSCSAAELIGLLDLYLRRACKRHPYARRCNVGSNKKAERPFGGLNFLFCGDLWQLPPVMATAIFSNPTLSNYPFHVQSIFKMFWRADVDSIQQTFILTQSMRTDDPWLREVLDADRSGAESWELYCFQHGLPTRNPGSWLPHTGAPTCGNAVCQTLANSIWPEMHRRGRDKGNNWHLRQSKECQICATERARRHCILIDASTSGGSGVSSATGQDDDVPRHKKPPFTDAPFVHPFRHPCYHAQQLRAISFAQTHGRRLLWITAYDDPKTIEKGHGAEKHEERKERWMEFHDRFTGGIPGLFPLVLDLPVRFTDAPNASAREQGVFKNARGWLRGWDLTEEEKARLAEMTEPEVVLQRRPKHLYIELEAPTRQMPLTDGKAIYNLAQQGRMWSLDAAGSMKVLRYGFNLVPDFGGTAHAYCGTTLDACIGDLLSWHQMPRREDALKAYIIKSRVRKAERLILAQPYSPHLFRQGVLIGPDLLLRVLTKSITWEEAAKLWKSEEKKTRQESSSGKDARPWYLRMEVPCRRCTDEDGTKEVCKPVSAFTASSTVSHIWKQVLAKGQDLMCLRCQHTLGLTSECNNVIPCDGCGLTQRLEAFSTDMQGLWQALSTEPLLCKSCEQKGQRGRPARADDPELILCNFYCKRRVPSTNFVATQLTEWTAQKMMLLAKCARCVVQDMKLPADYAYTCRRCKEKKHITCFSALHMKQWLAGERREETWACIDCQFPACCMCEDENRPLYPVSHNALINGKYYCDNHRYPPCADCGKARPQTLEKKRIDGWRCEDCRGQDEELAQCAECLKLKPRREFGDTLKYERKQWKCLSCRRPGCRKCGKVVLSMTKRNKGTVAYCSAECRFPPCTVCSEPRSKKVPYHVCVDWKCTSCK